MEQVQQIINEWKSQLDGDNLLRKTLEAALGEGERCDVELSIVLRTSGEKVVMEPKIGLRR